MLKALVAAVVIAVSVGSCGGESGYADVPVEEKPTRATQAQQDRYGVDAGTLVLLELLPSSYEHETGPSGAFLYRPYRLVFDCDGYLQVQEHYEYRRFLRDKAETYADSAPCPSGRKERGLEKEPGDGDEVWISVVDSENDDWGVLVVATDSD